MGIFPAITELLNQEHAHRPIVGDLLLIGRQLVEHFSLTDVELFADICPDARVRALDVSDYEGAEIIHDLQKPLPENLRGIADFIYDGSCLDNIHDPAAAVRNLSRLLRPNGRMFLFEHGTAIQGALLAYSPEWFFDFFAVNGYVDCQIKLASFPDKHKKLLGPWKLDTWDPYDATGKPVTATPGTTIGDFVNLVLAEKGGSSTDDRSPIQAQYRALHGFGPQEFWLAYQNYKQSRRRK